MAINVCNDIIKILAKPNKIVQDPVWKPSGDAFDHINIIKVTKMPIGTWRKPEEIDSRKKK